MSGWHCIPELFTTLHVHGQAVFAKGLQAEYVGKLYDLALAGVQKYESRYPNILR
ncbi:MAG: hypothetical protein NXI25_06940 [bacterium]|nr:hypothetical protein [bacterium]